MGKKHACVLLATPFDKIEGRRREKRRDAHLAKRLWARKGLSMRYYDIGGTRRGG